MIVEAPYSKDMSHVTWDEVFARQMKRADLAAEWIDALGVKAGDHVLDVGSGPGYVSLMLADRTGPDGAVYAIDRSAEALAHLERHQKERGISHIRRVVADAATAEPHGGRSDSALIAMMLHHADDPLAILRNVHRLVVAGGRAVIAEFHPEGPCEHGPPKAERLATEQVAAWCDDVGFHVLNEQRQTPEHYMLVVQRSDGRPNSSC